MTFYAFGLNHETAPLAVRQSFALDEAARRSLYRELQRTPGAEWIVLSTCNRTEVYLYGRRSDAAEVAHALARHAGGAWPEEARFFLEDEAAVRHVLYVACGLRSQVLGDAQILAQVKDAYRMAVTEDCVGTLLHRLMHTVFRTAKRVVTETALGTGAASISSAAVAEARAYFERRSVSGLTGRRVLLLGAGEMGRLAAEALRSYRLAELIVCNHSVERAQAVAAVTDARVVDWADRYDAARVADLILVATGASEPVLQASAMPAGNGTLVIDLAVPRNVDPDLAAAPGYTVLDLDGLHDRLQHTFSQRRAAVPQAERICEEALSEFVTWVFHQQGLQPAIQAIRDTFEAIRLQELDRHRHRFCADDQADLDRLTRSILQKLLAVPVVRLKSVDPESIDFVRGIKLLHALFTRADCEDPSANPVAPATVSGGTLPDKPAVCPFENPTSVLDAEQLREALRVPRRHEGA